MGNLGNRRNMLGNRRLRSGEHKNPAAVQLGRKGGKATAGNRTAEERSESARAAAQARWAKKDSNPRPLPIG